MRHRLACSAVAFLLGLGACGGGDSGEPATSASHAGSAGAAGGKAGAGGAVAGASIAGAGGSIAGAAGAGGGTSGFPTSAGNAGSGTSGAAGSGTSGSATAGSATAGSGTSGSGTSGSGGSCGVAPNEPAGPGGCSFPQGVPDEQFIASACTYQDTDPTVDAAVNAALAKLSGCSPGSDCPITGFPGGNADEVCQSWFAAVTDELRKQGFCAGQHAVGSTDEIAVSNTGCKGKWYGYHVCNYGGPKVVWNPGARRGWWAIAASFCP